MIEGVKENLENDKEKKMKNCMVRNENESEESFLGV